MTLNEYIQQAKPFFKNRSIEYVMFVLLLVNAQVTPETHTIAKRSVTVMRGEVLYRWREYTSLLDRSQKTTRKILLDTLKIVKKYIGDWTLTTRKTNYSIIHITDFDDIMKGTASFHSKAFQPKVPVAPPAVAPVEITDAMKFIESVLGFMPISVGSRDKGTIYNIIFSLKGKHKLSPMPDTSWRKNLTMFMQWYKIEYVNKGYSARRMDTFHAHFRYWRDTVARQIVKRQTQSVTVTPVDKKEEK
jgi:hypothetical protein